MEQLVSEGLVRNIGVANFNIVLLRDLLTYAKIKPSVLQVELHPYNSQEKLLQFCRQKGIAVTGFSPLGASSYVELGGAKQEDLLIENEKIKAIALKHQKSSAQVALRWGIQRGTSLVVKSIKKERLKENLEVFDFNLTQEEMKVLDTLNQNRRFNDPGVFCQSAFNTFFPIYE
jgi:D-xylose reductase